MQQEVEVIRDEKIVKVSDPENWQGDAEIKVAMKIAIASQDEVWQSVLIVARNIAVPYSSYLKFEWTGDVYCRVKMIYSHLKERIFDKIPEPVSREWFLDHGFIDYIVLGSKGSL